LDIKYHMRKATSTIGQIIVSAGNRTKAKVVRRRRNGGLMLGERLDSQARKISQAFSRAGVLSPTAMGKTVDVPIVPEAEGQPFVTRRYLDRLAVGKPGLPENLIEPPGAAFPSMRRRR